MKLESLGPVLLVAWAASSCSEEPRLPGAELAPAAMRATRQKATSTDKVLILGSTVNGGIDSPEAQAVRSYWPTWRPPVTIDVVTPEQWANMTPADFMTYHSIIIGDGQCTSGTAPFQAAIDNRDVWGPVIDGNVVIVGTNPTTGLKPQLMRNGIRQVIVNTEQFRTGLYVALGCAYQDAPPDTVVTLLDELGEFKVAGSASSCAATNGHSFLMSPAFLSVGVDDEYLGRDGCAARSVFTTYPFKNFALMAIGLNAPGNQEYIDYIQGEENPDLPPPSYFGTPYILVRGATAFGNGCGHPDYGWSEEGCDMGEGLNGQPALEPGWPPEATCSYSCRLNWCGDGNVDTLFGEQCDNGRLNGRTPDGSGDLVNGMCSRSCQIVDFPVTSNPPVPICQDRTVSAPADVCGADADINNGSHDPDNDLVGCEQDPPAPYNVGNTLVNLRCMDAAGNVATTPTPCTVTVRDITPPTVTVGQPERTVQCSFNGGYADLNDVTASELCSSPVTVQRSGTVTMRTPGSYLLTYSASDTAGNEGTATRTVNVVDTTTPNITLNPPTLVQLECGGTFTEPGWNTTDSCLGSGTLNPSVEVTGTVDPGVVGTYPLHYNLADPSGNRATERTRTVNVRDTTRPEVTILGELNLTVECNDSAYQDPGATATDTCAGTLPATAVTPPNVGTPGSYSVSYQATDPSGNVGTSATSRTVTVVDTLGPVLTLLGSASQILECATPWSEPGYSANDQCAGDITGLVQVTGSVDHMLPGPYSLRYTVTDSSGRSDSEDRAVTVSDTLAPSITVQGPLTDAFECGSTYMDPGATADDLCAGNVQVTSERIGNSGQPGTFTIRYSAEDPSGNRVTSPVERTVTVNDDTPPTLALLGPATETVECATSWTDQGATANDACFGDLTAAITREGTPSIGVPGRYPLTYRVTDGAGLSATPVTRTVNVNDTLAPSITVQGPLSLSVQCDHAPFADPGATATDSCAGNLNDAIVTTGSVTTGAAGSYTLSYRVSDPSGNQTIAGDVRTVTVVDDQAPTISLTGPANGTHECGSPYNDPGATANDACAGDLTPNIVRTDSVDGSAPGAYTLNYTVTDPSNLTASTQRQVTVNDTLAPVLTLNGQPTQDVECGPGYQDPGATATDACEGNLDARIQVSGAVDSTVVGDYNVTYAVSDNVGHAATPVGRQVQVRDTMAPTITVNEPLEQDFECGGTYVDPGATATDVCAGNVAVAATRSGSSTMPGQFTITYSATDPSNNTVTSSVVRTVHVNDNAPPALALVGSAAPVVECATAWNDPGATANDACFGDLTASIVREGDVDNMAPGSYPLTYRVTDGAGLSATPVQRNVTVQDTQPPVVTVNGPLNIPVECGDGTYQDPGATASDSCAGTLPAVPSTVADPDAPGSYVISYSATDPSGNVGTSATSRTVTVNDDTPPTLVLVGPVTESVECATSWTDQGAMANDACSGDLTDDITRTGSVSTGVLGSYPLIYNVMDGAGLSATPVTRTVNVTDTLPPSITVLGPLTLSVQCDHVPFNDPGAIATDSCAGDRTDAVETVGSVNTGQAGSYTLSYRVADLSDNQTTAAEVRTVTVVDDQAPTISLNGSANMTLECGSPYEEPGARARDACAGDLSELIRRTGVVNTAVVGSYTLRYTVSDPAHHSVTVLREVSVADTQPPRIVCPEPLVVETPEGTEATVPPRDATATDVCTPARVTRPTQTRFPIGTTELTYTATDVEGNTATCTTTITVNAIVPELPDLDRALLGSGNGCSSTGSGPSSLAMMGLGVLAVVLARKRTRALLPVLAVLLCSKAVAQPVGIPPFELERLMLNPSGRGSLLLGTGELLPHGDYRLSLTSHYENDPLLLIQNGSQVGTVVRHRATMHLAAAYGLWGWLELGAQVPVVLLQHGDDLTERGIGIPQGSVAPGTPMFSLQLKLLAQQQDDLVDLSLGVHAGPAVGSAAALAREFRGTPTIMVGRRFDQLRTAIDAGLMFRRRTILSPDANVQDEIGHALRLGATLSSLGEGLRGEVAVVGSVPLKREGFSIEALAGARWPVIDSFEAYGLAGLAFGNAPGTPDFRVLLGVAYGRARSPHVASIQQEPVPDPPELPDAPDQDGAAVPEKDSDGDDILDENDACLSEAGIPEMRGCPARDTDQDTVQDHLDNCPDVAGPVENQGCPAEEKQLVAIQKDRIEIKDTVHFDFDKATIQSRSFPLLDQVARILTEHPEILSVTIEGHTDERGSAEYNRDLSQRRAEAVRDYLAQKGVARERMEARGFGEERPVQSNATDEGRAANRRVEFITRYTQAGP